MAFCATMESRKGVIGMKTTFEELSDLINSDEYNKWLLEDFKTQAKTLIKTGKYVSVIYGVLRGGVGLNYTAPCLIPLTKEQHNKSKLDHAYILAVNK